MNIKQELKGILLRHEGGARAIKSWELAQIVQCDERKVRLIIRDLITEGLPIASSTEPPAGYFIVTTRQEKERYAVSIRSRIINDALRLKEFRQAADQYLTPAEQGVLL